MNKLGKLVTILAGISIAVTMSGFFGKKVEPPKTLLKISSEPTGATIYRGDAEIGKTPYQFNPKPGHYLLRIELENHHTQWLNLDLKRGTSTEKQVTLIPLTASVLIKSTPTGAKVILDKQSKGVTPLVIQNLELGTYEATIEKAGFEARNVTWKINDERPREVVVSLTSNIGRLIINSKPSRASVYLNGKLVGNTPYRADLEEGRYELKLSSPNYADITKTVIVAKNSEKNESLVLPILLGSIEITSIPTKAQVSLNGKPHGSTPQKLEKMQPGSYDVAVSLPNYDVQNRKVEIVPGQNVVAHFELSQNTSGLDLVVNPPGVEIYLNGKKIGVSEKDETGLLSKLISLRGLNAGKYTLMFAHRRAQPPQIMYEVELVKGEIMRIKPVNMWVANAELKLQGSKPAIGLLYSQDKDKVFFSPEPGVRVEYNRKDVEYLRLFEPIENETPKNDTK